jgi:hypothetical protein
MRFIAVTLLLLTAALFALRIGLLPVPARYNPWAPLDLTAPPNLVTQYKLYRIKRNPEACLEALRGTDIQFRQLDDRTDGACPLVNIVQVKAAGTSFNNSFMASCGLAAGWEIFRHNTLQQVAERHFNQRVTRVEHVGTYACRNVYSRPQGRRSEHARANAIDITGFVLADGTRIGVERDWDSRNQPKKAAFLRDIHQGACKVFNVVLGPDHNIAHANHFHFDMGGFWVCR